jgi:hypothetical protein
VFVSRTLAKGAVDLFVIASEAKQSSRKFAGHEQDCFVASLLAMRINQQPQT